MVFDFVKQQLFDSTLPQFQHMLGKKVSVETTKGEVWTGVLGFVGHNQHLGGKLQATISKTPVFDIKLNTLKLI